MAETIAEVRRLFSEADPGSTGKVSTDDFRRILQEVGDWTKENLDEITRLCDTDGTGVVWEEFVESMGPPPDTQRASSKLRALAKQATDPLWDKASEELCADGHAKSSDIARQVLKDYIVKDTIHTGHVVVCVDDLQKVLSALDHLVHNLEHEDDEDAIEEIHKSGLDDATEEFLLMHAHVPTQKRSTVFRSANFQPKRRVSQESELLYSRLVHGNAELQSEMDKIASWNDFDVFKLNQLVEGRVLQMTAMTVFCKLPWMEELTLNSFKLHQFTIEIEKQYNAANLYHNAIHGADCAASTHAMLQNFKQAKISTANCMATFVAAVCHDVAHPGVTNGFRVEDRDEDALTYNDMHVNEHMHASKTFRTLFREDCNFVDTWEKRKVQRMRETMIGIILATDMVVHFEKLKKFNQTVEEFGDDVDQWENDSIALQMLVHSMDISACAKTLPISLQWQKRCLDEFFAQGDRERELGRPISPLCDRQTVSRPNSQVGFVGFIVRPTFEALNKICDCGHALENLSKYHEHFTEEAAKEKAAAEGSAK